MQRGHAGGKANPAPLLPGPSRRRALPLMPPKGHSCSAGSESRAGQAWEQAGAQHNAGQAGTVLMQLQSAS